MENPIYAHDTLEFVQVAAEYCALLEKTEGQSEDALVGTVDFGSCGKNATWTLTGSGSNLTLTIR